VKEKMGKEATLKKAYEITDAKISFVSLVDKAANKKQFLITKAENGKANFSTYGRILKVDEEHHYVTGVVYEPLVKDAHDNYMTEEEIIKAAYWFAKNGDKVDLQHSFEELKDATVVETWVTKSDETIEDEEIKKGTWLMTVEISDPDIWEKVQKNEITGFSMGGVGIYSEEDVQLDDIQKSSDPKNEPDSEQKGFFKKLAKMFGLEVIEKGAMTDKYLERVKSNNFWSAFNTLEDILRRYNWASDKYEFEDDEDKIREVLAEFNEIVVELLTQKSITKALADSAKEAPVEKAGKSLSQKNQETLKGIYESLGTFLKSFDEQKEDEEDMEKQEVQKMIEEAIAKAVTPPTTPAAPATPAAAPQADATLTADAVQKMITKAVQEALGEKNDPEPVEKALTTDDVQEMLKEALEPLMKSRALPGNLNNTHQQVEKTETHYLHGIL
jgi:hypothetical protein